jgi:hypothetical protein
MGQQEQRVDFVNAGSVRKQLTRLVTLGATSVVVASFMASPVPAVATAAVPMAHISANYAHVTKAAVLPRGARRLGLANASKRISGDVALAPRNPTALTRAASAVSNPRSSTFRHYIAKGTFAASYGPTQATINAVEATLRASNLKVTSLSGNHLLVHFSGTVAAADSAFRTSIANVRLASGRIATATTKPVSFPASLASQVVSVVGLNTMVEPQSNIKRATHPATHKAVKAHFTHPTGSAKPCAAATGIANEFGGLTDDQIAHEYGLDSLYGAGDFGAGQTVAIYELEPFSMSDLTAFDTCYFGASAAATMTSHVTVTNVDGGPGTGSGSGESILDIDNVSAIAPGANIDVYQAPNGVSGPIDLYNSIVQTDNAKVVSTSWGECEALAQSSEPGVVNVENELFEQAALQGQSVFASSGDSGADDCAEEAPVPVTPTLSTDDPTSQPFVTSVGGTTTTNAQLPPEQQVWNDGNVGGGGGGGVSGIWGAPSWQQPFLDTASAAAAVDDGLSPCAQSPGDAALCREVPDVSANADEYTGSITLFIDAFGGWNTIGGTSSSAPLWAAMTAVINASTGCQTSGGVGFASPSLYAVASIPADYSASFNDLGAGDGSNDVYDLSNGQDYATKAGYDMASGLGTPILAGPSGQAGLASYLCALSAPSEPRPVITSLSRPTVAVAPTGSLTINGSGFTGALGVSIGGYDVPSTDWSATDDTHIVVSPIPSGAQALTGTLGPQDGAGRAFVSVTGSGGVSSVGADPDSELVYVAGTSGSPDPSVEGVVQFGGPQAGGNTVEVFGSGFTGVTGVTVGGVAATDVTVVNGNELTITVPAYDSGTTSCKSGDDEANDVCQAQVIVTNGNGSSAPDIIRIPYTGALFAGTIGGASLPDCATNLTCEVVPAETEYDYLPTPTITSVTTTSADDSTTWASEQGTTIATIDGSGFDSLGFLWTLVGNPASNNSQNFATLSVSPTEIQVVLPGHNPTTEPVTIDLSVQTLAGISAHTTFKYAGVPVVKAVSPQGGTDLGGTQIAVTGKGFQGVNAEDGGQVDYGYFDFDVATSQLTGYTANSDTSLTATTPENNPGEYIVQVCTVTFCSEPETFSQFNNSIFDFFEPGAPVVTGLSVTSGPASGGTRIVITGQNLADAFIVTFGKVVAEASSEPQILTNGSNTRVDAIVPPGKAGSTVHVRVQTAESLFTGGPPSAATSASSFTYKSSVASPPQNVTLKRHGTAVAVTWKPPASNGGHAVTKYRITAVSQPNSFKKGAKKPPNVVITTKHASTHHATITGLRGGWSYRIKVQAITSKGRGLPGERSSDPFIFITDPA